MLAAKKAKSAIHLYNDDTVKWEHDGRKYCLHVQQDDQAESPREWDNITVMACWHRRYRLGDKIEDSEPEGFWRRLVRENVPESEVYAIAEAGKLPGIRITQNEENPELVNVYETSYWHTVIGDGDPVKCLEYEGVDKDTAVYYLMDDLTIGQCMTLMEPYAEWMPLWLYDHSGITMSCGARTGQFDDHWDSMQVGWIVALKETIMKETVEYILDENGEKIRIEYKHEGQSSTWSYLTRQLTEETWRKRAIEIMESDVEVYDQYLTGEVYGFELHEAELDDYEDDPDWQDSDSCWGFYGTDVLESGLADEVGCGLVDALKSGKYESGKAKLHTMSYYKF